jgi:hypothetical protein
MYLLLNFFVIYLTKGVSNVKKIIGIFLCIVIMLAFCSCENLVKEITDVINASKDLASQADVADNNDAKNTQSKDAKNNKDSNEKNSSKKDDKNSSKDQSGSKENYENSFENSTNTSSKKYSFDVSTVSSSSNGITLKEMQQNIVSNIPAIIHTPQDGTTSKENSQNQTSASAYVSSGHQPVLGEDYGAYAYEGTFVNLVTEGNMVYSIFKSPNNIVVYDTDELDVVYTKTLPGRPAEIQVDGNNLLISFPDLRCIKVFNKNTFDLVNNIQLSNIVSSFCIDEEVVYYSEDDQHCSVFCENLKTKETTRIGSLFYFPKLLLNKEKGLLYIGEKGCTGCLLYYYKTSDFSLHSKFAKNNYGLFNGKRTMYLVNDNVFWGGFRFASDNAGNVVGEYGGDTTYYADENFVITASGIYGTDSYAYMGDTQNSDFLVVTSNKCLVAVFKNSSSNVVVAIPY